jgi:ketosteroid isomerase-like protein
MSTHVETLPARHTARNVWVTVGVLVLLALATPAVVQAIDANIAAINAADQTALAATYAGDAVMTDLVADAETVGADEIAAFYVEGDEPGDWSLQRKGDVVQIGDYAASAFSWG